MMKTWPVYRLKYHTGNNNNDKKRYTAHHFPVARVHDGAVDVELVDDVRGLVPPPFSHRLLSIHLP